MHSSSQQGNTAPPLLPIISSLTSLSVSWVHASQIKCGCLIQALFSGKSGLRQLLSSLRQRWVLSTQCVLRTIFRSLELSLQSNSPDRDSVLFQPALHQHGHETHIHHRDVSKNNVGHFGTHYFKEHADLVLLSFIFPHLTLLGSRTQNLEKHHVAGS